MRPAREQRAEQRWTGTSSRFFMPPPRRAASPMQASSSACRNPPCRARFGARTGACGRAVPSARTRAHPDRAGRTPLSDRARRVHEARSGARKALRQPREAERRAQGDDQPRHRRALAHAAARRVHRPLSRGPPHADHQRRGARPFHARGGCGDPPAPTDAARPDSAQAVRRAFPCLRVARLSQALRHAAHARRSRRAPYRALGGAMCQPICRTGAG